MTDKNVYPTFFPFRADTFNLRFMPSRAPRRPTSVLLALLATLLLSPGCLVRRLKVIRPGIASSAKLQMATLEQLLEKLRAWDQQVRTVNATMDLEPSVGSVLKGEISELKDVRGFVLIRKPQTIRMIGLYPVVRNRAFDMVSDGTDFKLYVPAKNKFIIGKNRLDQPSPNRLENLRPQHVFEALMVRPPFDGERPFLENDTDELHANYVVHLVREREGKLALSRNIWFERVHLNVVRQQIFEENGDIVSDARYGDYDSVGGVLFPKRFTVMRPKDEYGFKLSVQKLELNTTLGDDKFALAQPPGSELMNISEPAAGPKAPVGDGSKAEEQKPAQKTPAKRRPGDAGGNP